MKKAAPALALALAAAWCLLQGWLRDLWFDEALTVLQFLPLEYAKIYSTYPIPNNHIGYTWFLKWWSQWNFGLEADYFWRLGSMATALAALMLLYFRHWRELGGRWAAAVFLGCFALSLPFALYGTAVRGYMLSFLLVVLTLEAGRAAAGKGGWKWWCAYALASVATVAVIPGNLVALAGVVIYLAPECGNGWKFLRNKSFCALVAIPVLAALVFYAPIAPAVLRAMALKEGWPNGWYALGATYGSFALVMLPMWLFAWRGWKKQRGMIRWCAFLLPVLPALCLTVAPFPRMYFPLWPVWLLLLGGVWRGALIAAGGRKRGGWMLAAVIGIGVWSIGCRHYAEPISAWMGGERWTESQDDWFAPYYRRDGFAIRPTAQRLTELATRATPVYVSFDADPFPVLFYGPEARYILWNTTEKALRPGTLAVLAADGGERELLELQKRFQLRQVPELLWENEFHQIYRVR